MPDLKVYDAANKRKEAVALKIGEHLTPVCAHVIANLCGHRRVFQKVIFS